MRFAYLKTLIVEPTVIYLLCLMIINRIQPWLTVRLLFGARTLVIAAQSGVYVTYQSVSCSRRSSALWLHAVARKPSGVRVRVVCLGFSAPCRANVELNETQASDKLEEYRSFVTLPCIPFHQCSFPLLVVSS